MPGELVFTIMDGLASPAIPTSLQELGFVERSHLQEWVRANPEMLGPNIEIVTFEFDEWQARESVVRDRLDLLGLDGEGRLVVAELKRGRAGDTIELQAIKYAAFASRFTPDILSEKYAAYLSNRDGENAEHVTVAEARRLLEAHGGELDAEVLSRPRIVLLAAGFSPQVWASVVWLTEMGVSIELMEFSAYKTGGKSVLTVSQVWPVSAIDDFIVSPRELLNREADEKVRTHRETRAVITLVHEETIEDGEELHLDVAKLPRTVRRAVEEWVNEDAERGKATWKNIQRAPLVWKRDLEQWSPSGLTKEIISQATGDPYGKSVGGPGVWVTSSGESLTELAGIGSAVEKRDWSDLHQHLDNVPSNGESVEEVADAIGSSPRAVIRHVQGCPTCEADPRFCESESRDS